MTGHGEEASPKDSRPERVIALEKGSRKRSAKIKNLKFVRHFPKEKGMCPAAWNVMHKQKQADESTREIQHHLRHIRPDDRCHPAFKGIEQCQADDDRNRSHFSCAQYHGDDD